MIPPTPRSREFRRTTAGSLTPTHRCSTNTQPRERDRYAGGGWGGEEGADRARGNSSQGMWRKREGNKRGLQDTLPVSYEEYDTSWDQEDQSKKCKKSVNCLLEQCACGRGVTVGGQSLQPMRRHLECDVTTVDACQDRSVTVREAAAAPGDSGRRAGTRGTADTKQHSSQLGKASGTQGQGRVLAVRPGTAATASNSNTESIAESQSHSHIQPGD